MNKNPAYWMNRLKIIDEGLELEREYRYDLDKKVEECIRKFKIYFWTTLITGMVNIPMIWLLAKGWGGGVGNHADDTFLKIAGASVAFLGIFTIPGFIVSVYKAVYYRHRCTYNKDTKDGKWKTYQEMADVSGRRTAMLEEQRNEAVVNITTSRFEENRGLEIDDMSDGAEPAYLPDDVMSFSELLNVMKKD